MRSISVLILAVTAVILTLAPRAAHPAAPPEPDDLLGELIVEAASRSAPLRLPKLVLLTGPELGEQTKRVLAIVRRDLELCGELDVREETLSAQAQEMTLDRDEWKGRGFAFALQVSTSPGGGGLEARATLTVLSTDDEPARTSTSIAPRRLRHGAHELADRIIGLATGYRGPFTSQLAFVRTEGGSRRVHVIDADGHGPRPVSPPDRIALAPAYGPDDRLYYSASIDNGRYRLYRVGARDPIPVEPSGSIYGIAFTDDREKLGLAIASGPEIRIHVGDSSNLTALTPASKPSIALHPAFSSSGTLAFAGTVKNTQRVYVDGRPMSRPGLSASSPTFCPHPDGIKLVYSVGARNRAAVVVADERGFGPGRITDGRARNSSPACSPDGRLVAFFSDRKGGEGPGLYLMRVDGRRVRKIAPILGDSLRWARIESP